MRLAVNEWCMFSGRMALRMAESGGFPMIAWIVLFVAGLFEVVWAIGLKYSNGLTELVPAGERRFP